MAWGWVQPALVCAPAVMRRCARNDEQVATEVTAAHPKPALSGLDELPLK